MSKKICTLIINRTMFAMLILPMHIPLKSIKCNFVKICYCLVSVVQKKKNTWLMTLFFHVCNSFLHFICSWSWRFDMIICNIIDAYYAVVLWVSFVHSSILISFWIFCASIFCFFIHSFEGFLLTNFSNRNKECCI